jgi:hypothetical protein
MSNGTPTSVYNGLPQLTPEEQARWDKRRKLEEQISELYQQQKLAEIEKLKAELKIKELELTITLTEAEFYKLY